MLSGVSGAEPELKGAIVKTKMKKAGFKGGQLVTNFHEVQVGGGKTGVKEGKFVNSNQTGHTMGVGKPGKAGGNATMKTSRKKAY